MELDYMAYSLYDTSLDKRIDFDGQGAMECVNQVLELHFLSWPVYQALVQV